MQFHLLAKRMTTAYLDRSYTPCIIATNMAYYSLPM